MVSSTTVQGAYLLSNVYIVAAKRDDRRALSMGTHSAADAIQCAHQFLETGNAVSITDQIGTVYTVKEFETSVSQRATPDDQAR